MSSVFYSTFFWWVPSVEEAFGRALYLLKFLHDVNPLYHNPPAGGCCTFPSRTNVSFFTKSAQPQFA